ncbi:MAG: hypothetical protein PUB46_00735 [Lachnospiraceae bacterium]|nr:hypothetical protein [Roseburia hominis]MDD6168589.1 hypothetical protein [Lachnospiraceae bacterium]MDY4839930.1 hypothetical protein [Lachnospiraceae bacterium]
MKPVSPTSFTNFSVSSNHKKNAKNKSTKKSFSIHRSMNETGYLMRLAQAKTPSQVAAVVSIVRMDAKSVRQSSENSTEIAKAKRIARSIEKQATIKSAKLRRENQLKKEALTERAAKNLKRAKKTTETLVKKRRVRKAIEHVAIANSIPLDNKKQVSHIDTRIDDNTDLSFPNTQSSLAALESTATSASGSSVDCCI